MIRWACLAGAVITLVVGLAYNAVTGATTAPDTNAGAIDVCRLAIEQHLKAPATASYANETVTHVGTQYTVVGDVDSENSFGAKLRSRYFCSATLVSDDKWQSVVSQLAS